MDEALSVTDEGHWAVGAQTVPVNSATADNSEQLVPAQSGIRGFLKANSLFD